MAAPLNVTHWELFTLRDANSSRGRFQTIASGPNSMTVRAASVMLPDSDG
jgi:hypothetical protein